ncbi:MAG: hypothetical protein A2W07_07430 [candidate division Zixibacteria bacterium RBG_16_43_9]|nr:MAG: hypothetical protein A2W07_07430 [candidate division Zixibacteria bacterium RBG_16_43_9]
MSPIQIQFFLYLNSHTKRQRRISHLAEEFGLTQATVSDAVKALMKKGLLLKMRSQEDGRIATLELTPSGRRLVVRLLGWQSALQEQIKKFPPETKEVVMIFLMEVIAQLQKAGIISIVRMCITCGFFRRDAYPGAERPHHCELTDRPIANSELRIDCHRHKPKLNEVE